MIYKLNDLNQSAMKQLSRPQQAERLLVYLLESSKCINEKNTLLWNDISLKYKALVNKHKDVISISENSLYQYAVSFVKQSESPVCQLGHGKGFYLDLNILEREQVVDTSENKDHNSENPYQEKNMYPILVDWLSTNLGRSNDLYGVKNVSSARGMEKWNNPDILGIAKCSFFNTLHLELVTLEAKRDWRNWRQDIFEAVAHTLLANKSYFVFLRKSSDKVEDEKDMIVYAQKFGIGILSLVVPEDKWGETLTYETIERFDIIVPASYHTPQVKMQKRFLASLNIKEPDDIDRFFNEMKKS